MPTKRVLRLPHLALNAWPSMTVEACLAKKTNNFDLIRLSAALLVLWSHTYPLTGDGPGDVFSKLLHGYDMAGSFSVAVFFIISGFLITRSAEGRTSADFLAARCFRIFPALVFAVLLTVFVIGPILTKMPLAAYFSDPSTKSYLGNVFVYDMQYNLADTTKDLPYSFPINSSLWTLSVEFTFYIVVLVLIKARLMGVRTASVIVAASVVIFLWAIYKWNLTPYNQGGNIMGGGGNVWRGVGLYYILKYGASFLTGSAFWVYRKHVLMDARLAGVAASALLLGFGTDISQVIYVLAVPYLVLYVAIGLPYSFDLTGRIGDLSYGIYVIAFPVQQTVIHFSMPHLNQTKISVIATVISALLATFSWHVIEKPALSMKPRSRAATAPTRVDHAAPIVREAELA